jgi:hypothetical protein
MLCFTKYLQFQAFLPPAALFSASSNKTPPAGAGGANRLYRGLAACKGDFCDGSDTAGPVGQNTDGGINFFKLPADFLEPYLYAFELGIHVGPKTQCFGIHVGPQASHLGIHIGPQNIDCLENHFRAGRGVCPPADDGISL